MEQDSSRDRLRTLMPMPERADRGGRGRWLLALVLAVEVAAFAPALMRDGVLRAPETKASDGTSQVYVWKIFWRDEILAGRAPLWNPFVFAGTPAFAEPQIQTFYPGNALWLMLPAETASKLTLLLHIMLASGLMFGLARAVGASGAGAALAALAFGLHGQIAIFSMGGWVQMIAPMAWAPGVLWGLVRACEPGATGRRAIAAAGLGLGIQFLSGHPEWVRYTLLSGALLVLFTRGGATLARRSRAALAVLALGVLVGGPQLFSTIQAAARTGRGQQAVSTRPNLHGAALPPVTLPTLLAPRVFGPWDLDVSTDGLIHKARQARVGFGESLIYVGVLPLGLALVAIGRRVPGSAPWLAIAITGAAFALNDVTHLQCLFDRLVPPDAMFRSPARFTFMANLALAVLAGLGVTAIERTPLSRRAVRIAVAAAVVTAVAALTLLALRGTIVDAVLARVHVPQVLLDRAAGGMTPQAFGAWAIGHAARHLVAAALFIGAGLAAAIWFARAPQRRAAILIAVTAADLGFLAAPFLTSVVDIDRVYARDLALLAPLAVQPGARFDADDGVLDAGSNVGMLARVRALHGYDTFLLREYERMRELTVTRDPMTMRSLGVTHVISRGDVTPAIAAVAGSLGRAWWTPASSSTLAEASSAAVASGGRVTIARDDPGRVELVVDAPSPGAVVVTDAYYPGWRASVNGEAGDVTRAFDMMQRIDVPAGSTRVVLEFRPAILWWAFGACALGLVLVAALWRPGS